MANESMIAACPKCAARYKLDRARLCAEGVRLRCTRCEAVFRVTPPAAVSQRVEAPSPGPAPPSPDPSPPDPIQQTPSAVADAGAADAPAAPRGEVVRRNLVLLADSEVEAGKALAHALVGWGLEPMLVHDGVEAILTIQRSLPRVVILDAALPKMFGFQVCELVKRNESLRGIHVVLVGAIHHRDRYRRAPTEIYGADAYVERPELPEALGPILQRFGFQLGSDAAVPEVPPAPARGAAVPPLATEPLEDLYGSDPASAPAAPEAAADDLEAPLLDPPASPLEPLASPVAPLASSADRVDPLASQLEPPASPLDPLSRPVEPLARPFEPLAGPVDPLASSLAPLPSESEPSPVGALASTPEPSHVEPLAVEAPTAELPLPQEVPQEASQPAQAPTDPAVAAAERLARIIVSDVVLYNPEKFEEGVRRGNVVQLLDTELEEGRGLFEQRVAAELRTGRDFLAEELLRVARSKGMNA